MARTEDSPPPFVKFKSGRVDPTEVAYRMTLDLVSLVHTILEQTDARFHLKDKLDRATTAVTMEIARANVEVRAARWGHYRRIVDQLAEVVASLDIIDRQKATKRTTELAEARTLAKKLGIALRPLARLGTD
ncbi:MAG: hypothetical protein QM831_04645 [Kofleriaceae bacterium]